MIKRLSVLGILLMMLCPSFAQRTLTANDMASHYSSYGFTMDQDLFVNMFKLGEDRNYTMGAGFYFSSDRLRNSWITWPVKWTSRKLYGKLDPALEQVNGKPFAYSIALANGTFTPDDLRDYNVIPNDRPYGNVTYLQETVSNVTEDAAHRKFVKNSSSIAFGIIGTQISRVVQTAIHTSLNDHDTKPPYTPRGWPHQVSNGGEPTLLLTRSSERLVTTGDAINNNRGSWSAEVKHGWKYSVGYYTSAEYDLNMRFGFLDAFNWTYDANPLDDANKNAGSFTPLYHKQTRGEVYIVTSARPVFMLYNALMNGQFKKSDFTIDFAHTRHVFLQWDLAIAGRIPGANGALDLKWRVLSGRTPEFELPGRDPRSHYWGGFDIVYTHYR